MKDRVEWEYERAITDAISRGDNNAAHELYIGLIQYRKWYK